MDLRRQLVVILAIVLARSAGGDEPKQQKGEFEHRFIVGVGGAFELEVTGPTVHGGGSAFFEWEAIDNWLELELGRDESS